MHYEADGITLEASPGYIRLEGCPVPLDRSSARELLVLLRVAIEIAGWGKEDA